MINHFTSHVAKHQTGSLSLAAEVGLCAPVCFGAASHSKRPLRAQQFTPTWRNGPDGMGRDEELGRLGKWLVFTHRNGVFTTKKCGFHPQLCKRTHIFSCSGTLWSTNLAMANDPLYNWVNHKSSRSLGHSFLYANCKRFLAKSS